jgi:ABC-type molybdate transport system ATPase subunit
VQKARSFSGLLFVFNGQILKKIVPDIYIPTVKNDDEEGRCMEAFIKNYHETYNAAKVNELLQRIKAHNENADLTAKVSEAMRICGFDNGDIEQVVKQLRKGDSP